MRNPTSNLPEPLTGQIHRFVDINSLNMHPHSLIDSVATHRDESVEAKWEQIQYFEAKENPSLSSLASSSTTASSSASSTASKNSDKLRSRLAKMKQNSLKKLSNFKLWNKKQSNNGYEAPMDSEVSHAPNGVGMLPKLRASKSMQNLEQLTRDSIYNLKDISSNLKAKYNSRMDLRAQHYNELWDEDNHDDDTSEDEDDFYHNKRTPKVQSSIYNF